MKIKFLVIISVLLLLNTYLSSCLSLPKNNIKSDNYSAALEYALNHLPKTGTLIQQSDGYGYLKVDDDYINKLYPLLNAEGFHKPPYFRRKDAPGAHVSVVYEKEHVILKEVGLTYNFTLKSIVLIHTNSKTSYIILKLEAPNLEELRSSYGLSKKLLGHEFHITLAKRVAH